MINIAIFASGSGTNAENIARIFNEGSRLKVALVVTNRRKAGVIGRMEALGVPVEYVPNSVWDEAPEKVVDLMRERGIDLIVLAGFMHFVSPVIVEAFRGRILNIHPSLLPAYGGKGMYGHYVHEAVVAAGEKESGVTVHYVTEEMDKGEIVMQERVEVTPDDTPESLEAKIHPVEYSLYPRAIVKAAERIENERRQDPPAPAKPSVEKEWADVLHLNYDPTKAEVPPPVPGSQPVSGAAGASGAAPVASVRSASPAVEPMPQAWLLWSVLATVFCCTVAGIVAIIYSSQVSARYYQGDIEGSRRASRRAEAWIIASVVVGVAMSAFWLPLMLLS